MQRQPTLSYSFMEEKEETPLIINNTEKEEQHLSFIRLLTSTSITPSKAYTEDAGYDIFSAEEKIIKAHSYDVISTGIAFLDENGIPPGYYCRIAPRSGLACKSGIDIGAGVIDRGYTGEIKICMFNHSSNDFHVKVGDKIAQLIFTACFTNLAFVTTSCSSLVVSKEEKKTRGDAGFGSTD